MGVVIIRTSRDMIDWRVAIPMPPRSLREKECSRGRSDVGVSAGARAKSIVETSKMLKVSLGRGPRPGSTSPS